MTQMPYHWLNKFQSFLLNKSLPWLQQYNQVKTTLIIFSFKCLELKNELSDPHFFYYQIVIGITRCKVLQSLKKLFTEGC